MRGSGLRRTGTGWQVRLLRARVAWFAGLVLLLCTDLVIRNTDADLPEAAVFAAWAVAFVLPALVVHGCRRRATANRASRQPAGDERAAGQR